MESVEPPEPAKKLRRTRWGSVDASNAEQSEKTSTTTPNLNSKLASQPLNASTSNVPSLDVSAVAIAARAALEKARKAALCQRQIQEQFKILRLGNVHLMGNANVLSFPRPLRLDTYGRELDEEGNVIPIRPQVHSTLKINLNREKEVKKKAVAKIVVEADVSKSKWFDPTLESRKQKPFQGLNFIRPGTFIKKEQQMLRHGQAKALGIDLPRVQLEKKLQLQRDQKRHAAILKEMKEDFLTGDDSFNPNLIPLGGSSNTVTAFTNWEGSLPEVEWWDLVLVQKHKSEDTISDAFTILYENVGMLVEHPVPIVSNSKSTKSEAPVMFLTKKERSKIRRRRRQEKEQTKQDMIRMGMMAPLPPKIKLSNLMRVLGDTAVSDPSRVEAAVKQQMEKRLKSHEEQNQARRLPIDERKKKRALKWMPSTPERAVALFIIRHAIDKRSIFKVDMNAQQFHIKGSLMICPDNVNVTVAEGSSRSIKRFKHLMLSRIDWKDQQHDVSESTMMTEPQLETHSPCVLVWEGTVNKPSFNHWKVLHVKTEAEAKKWLGNYNSVHYWTMISKFRDTALDN